MRRAFTLIEVNLAMLIMAGGILAMVSLYSLGYRENSQSREDVAGAALADAVMSPIVMAASATNLKWSVFSNLNSDPNNGWAGYLNTSTGLVSGDPEGKVRLMLEDREIADPWYTRNFRAAWNDIHAGCTALVDEISANAGTTD